MKITLIGHACILIQVDGINILSDPWWRGPCFGGQWWLYPDPYLQGLDKEEIDYIYISHGHHDHFHPGTLKTLSRKSKVLVSGSVDLAGPIGELGFPVSVIADDESYRLTKKATCRIIQTHGLDTLMAVSDGTETCLNLNDALHSAPSEVQESFTSKLRRLYPSIDYVFCGYGMASHFPNCYVIPDKDQSKSAAKRQRYFNRQWAIIVKRLSPRFAFPFAADVVFLEHDLFWVNEAAHNSERPTESFKKAFPDSETRAIDIAPGFTIENGNIADMRVRERVSAELLRTTRKDQIERANRYGRVDEVAVKEMRDLLQHNIAMCLEHLSSFRHDYRFLIKLHSATQAICVEKTGKIISANLAHEDRLIKSDYDVIYTTRLPYLRLSLTTKYGHEILFVGSGGIFEYLDEAQVKKQLHRELMTMMERQASCPRVRLDQSAGAITLTKRLVKKLLGIRTLDLYDLEQWTVSSH